MHRTEKTPVLMCFGEALRCRGKEGRWERSERAWEGSWFHDQNLGTGISLVVQWLRLCPPNAGGLGLIPGQETRSHMPQLRVCMPQLHILHATTKTRYSQIEKKKKLGTDIFLYPTVCQAHRGAFHTLSCLRSLNSTHWVPKNIQKEGSDIIKWGRKNDINSFVSLCFLSMLKVVLAGKNWLNAGNAKQWM